MLKDEFEKELRKKLQEVPLVVRQTWYFKDLLNWWDRIRVEHPYLTWERRRGPIWQWVKTFCKDLIGHPE